METTTNSATANQISNRLLKSSVCRLLKKSSEARRAKNRSFGSAQDRLGGGVLDQYVGAR